jgi:hypothetical protein
MREDGNSEVFVKVVKIVSGRLMEGSESVPME